jgi:UDP-N-acetylglucosamine--N-acetylmuramyl-(pentapeptide) pyrophosphoryl-undecaprenol N-acetylglucosamine transferase
LAHGEHVDDHQIQIALELARRGLSVSVEAEALSDADLLTAAGRRVATLTEEPPFPTCTP